MAPTLRSRQVAEPEVETSPLVSGKYRKLGPHEVKQEPLTSSSSSSSGSDEDCDSDEDLFHDPADSDGLPRSGSAEESEVEASEEEESSGEEEGPGEELASEEGSESIGTNDSTRSNSVGSNVSDASRNSFIAGDDSTIEMENSSMDVDSDGSSEGSVTDRRRSSRVEQQEYYADYEEYSTSPSDDQYSIRTTESEFSSDSDEDDDFPMHDGRTQTRITDFFNYV